MLCSHKLEQRNSDGNVCFLTVFLDGFSLVRKYHARGLHIGRKLSGERYVLHYQGLSFKLAYWEAYTRLNDFLRLIYHFSSD